MNFEVDASNIVTGRRTRRGTKRLVDSKDWQESYMSLVLEDVPDGEIEAALNDTVDDDDTILSSENDETEKKLYDEEDSFLASDSAESQHSDDEFSVLSSADEDELEDEEDIDESEKSDVKPRAQKKKPTVTSNFCVEDDDIEEEFQ